MTPVRLVAQAARTAARSQSARPAMRQLSSSAVRQKEVAGADPTPNMRHAPRARRWRSSNDEVEVLTGWYSCEP